MKIKEFLPLNFDKKPQLNTMGAFFYYSRNLTYDTAYDQNKSRHFFYKVAILLQNFD